MCPLGPVRFYSGWQEWGAFLSHFATEFLVNHSWVGNSNQPAAGPQYSVEELYPAGGEEGGEGWMEGKTAHLLHSHIPISPYYGFIFAISVKGQQQQEKTLNHLNFQGLALSHISHTGALAIKAKNTLQDVSLSSTETMTGPLTCFMIC